LTLTELEALTGEPGNFTATLRKKPRYVDLDKCIGCGLCAEKCPKKVADEYNLGLAKRKAIYVKYSQTVPLKYAIDPDACIYFKKGTCKACEKHCPAGAIKLDDREELITRQVGAVILATGFKPFDPKVLTGYGYGKHPGVVTSLEFERILSASGPFGGHLVRPADKTEPRRIAWLQCVGSRDSPSAGSHSYCSGVCCMYAVKQALVTAEHLRGRTRQTIFFMDLRAHNKEFERYYQGRPGQGGALHPPGPTRWNPGPNRIGVRLTINEDGRQVEEDFDLVVLSVGLEIPPDCPGAWRPPSG
jgi:heterodisulfide reductase subunit A